MDSGIECTLSKFVDNNKLCGAVNTMEVSDAIQMDLDKLERWAHANLVKFATRASIGSCTWVRVIPSTNMGWMENRLRAALPRRTWRCWLMRSSV